ncbi:dTDP-4-dehydrorhamnose 3,5-epimerase family protein [Belnapia moabensis]|uniref:dTDP-4-dehydrorhamnose 3,5-epimerase family protein n=1 Tax=Belnapia moabensis TaxID=365533 RepID=UPI000694F224|nr:dTDP-4-dehydrorhamnose 3,5-epimerase [Belnapia moabensis]
MTFHPTALTGAFARTMCREEFAAHGLIADFAQQSLSVTVQAGTLRGMHFQREPTAEAKLIRCIRGAVHDVIVDLRAGSPSFMRHEAFELSAANGQQLYVPPGFVHGFQTLADDVEMTYLISAPSGPRRKAGCATTIRGSASPRRRDTHGAATGTDDIQAMIPRRETHSSAARRHDFSRTVRIRFGMAGAGSGVSCIGCFCKRTSAALAWACRQNIMKCAVHVWRLCYMSGA